MEEAGEDVVKEQCQNGEVVFTCNVCHGFKGTLEKTHGHWDTEHMQHKLCAVVFKTNSGLHKHSKKHVETIPTKCRGCLQTFAMDSDKRKHACIETGSSNKPSRYSCQHSCGYNTGKVSDKRHHETTCDLNPLKEMVCTQCKQTFQGKIAYDQHVAVMHAPRNPKTRCGYACKAKK